MKKKDLNVVRVNDHTAFVFAYEVRVRYTFDDDFDTVVTYFDRNKAIRVIDNSFAGRVHSCYIAKIRIWL